MNKTTSKYYKYGFFFFAEKTPEYFSNADSRIILPRITLNPVKFSFFY